MKRPLVTLGVLLLLGAAVLVAQTAAPKPEAKATKPAAKPQQPSVPACAGILEILPGNASPWVKIVQKASCNKGQTITFEVRNSDKVGHKIDIAACIMIHGTENAGCKFPPATIPANGAKQIADKVKDGAVDGPYHCDIKVDDKAVPHAKGVGRPEVDPDIEVTKPPTTGRGRGNQPPKKH